MIRLFRIIINACLLITLLAVNAVSQEKDKIFDQKKELEQIKKDVQKSRQKLDSLKNIEVNIQKQIAQNDQKIATNEKIISRLNKEMNQLRSDITKADNKLSSDKEHLNRVQRRYLGNIRQFYFATRTPDFKLTKNPNDELELNRQVMYLTSMAGFESSNILHATQILESSVERIENLSGQKSKVSKLKQKKVTSTSLEKSKKRQQEKTLGNLRRLGIEERDRIITLEQAAKEMMAIIERLERERIRLAQEKAEQENVPSVFATLRGQLFSPFKGKITVPFGNSVHPVTKLKSFSPGIVIKGKAGRNVYAVASGSVAYVGNLRGYGKFVIMNHENQYYTTYAGLGEIIVSEKMYLFAGDKLAVAGNDGNVKFELRKGREPLDPVKWIQIDSF